MVGLGEGGGEGREAGGVGVGVGKHKETVPNAALSQPEVSDLVFYAQSTITVIPGRGPS